MNTFDWLSEHKSVAIRWLWLDAFILIIAKAENASRYIKAR